MFARVSQYFQQDLWEVDLQTLSGVHRFGVAFFRLVMVAAWEFKESVLSIRATSLVYTTLLSLVPFFGSHLFRPQRLWHSSTDRTRVGRGLGTPGPKGDGNHGEHH